MRLRFWIAMIIGFGATVRAYDDLGLRPLIENPADSTRHLGMSERLEQIDALLERLEGSIQAPDSLRRRLVALYAGSPLMKHRIRALEQAAPRAGESLSPERSLDRAQAHLNTFNPWEADRLFERVVRQFPQWARGHRSLGNFLFEGGAKTLDDDLLADAQAAYERAAVCPDAGYDDWLGIAACMVARDRRDGLPAVAERLRTIDPDARASCIYAAIADWDLGLTRSAEAQLRRVVDSLAPDTARCFVEVADFLRSREPLQLDDASLQPPLPRGMLEWQMRVVEAEILFADRSQMRHGWQSAPGQAWLIYGRPLRHYFFPPFTWSPGHEIDADDILSQMTGLEAWRSHLFRAMEETSTANGIWIWEVQLGERRVPYVFQANAAFAEWDHNPIAQQVFLEPMKHSLPLNLARTERAAPEIALSSRHATFRASGGAARIECAVAVDANPSEDASRVRWRLLDEADSLVSESVRPLAEMRPRAALIPGMPEAATRLGQLAAIVTEGEYISRLELLRADGSTVTGTEELVRVRPRGDDFGMSELLLADSFHRLQSAPTDGEFVRHAIMVVPHPEHAAFDAQREFYVYYEIYDAQLDEEGNAHLDVQYQIFDAAGFDPFEVGREGSARVGLRFRDERTGISPSGVMVRGTAIPVDELDSGEYVLSVSVADRLRRAQAHRTLRFAR